MRFFYLDVQSASVCATNSKFPEESTIQHRTLFTLQDIANTPPQMPLDNPEFTAYVSSLLKKALQNGLNTHVLEKSLIAFTCQVTPYGSPKSSGVNYVEQIRHSSRMSLQECLNRSHKNDDTPHWVPIVTQGCFWDNKALFHALGASSSMTELTTNSTL